MASPCRIQVASGVSARLCRTAAERTRPFNTENPMHGEPIAPSRGLRVLVVDDEMLICLLIETILLDAGYQVTVANTIAEASCAIDAGETDLAILDINVRGQKTYSIADRLGAAGIPFIFATGGGPEPPPYPNRPCLTKPFNEADLLAAVARLAGPSSLQP